MSGSEEELPPSVTAKMLQTPTKSKESSPAQPKRKSAKTSDVKDVPNTVQAHNVQSDKDVATVEPPRKKGRGARTGN